MVSRLGKGWLSEPSLSYVNCPSCGRQLENITEVLPDNCCKNCAKSYDRRNQ